MDARVRYTKKVIKEVFLDILKNTPVDRITVTEICSRAQINRATFYKYYSNPEDLLEKLELEQLEELNARIDAGGDTSSGATCMALLQDLKENKDFYQVALGKNGNSTFQNQIYGMCVIGSKEIIASYFPELPSYKQAWLHTFLASGYRSVLESWQNNGMNEDIEDIAAFINLISYQVMNSPLK